MENWKIIEVRSKGKIRRSGGGCWTYRFVYSNKGNFILKGFERETNEFLKLLVLSGFKYVLNTVYYTSRNYTVWSFYNPDIQIRKKVTLRLKHHKMVRDKISKRAKIETTIRYKSEKWQFFKYFEYKKNVIESKPIIEFKRFPNRWVPEFDKL